VDEIDRPLRWTANLDERDVEVWLLRWASKKELDDGVVRHMLGLVLAARQTVTSKPDVALRLAREGAWCRMSIEVDSAAVVSCCLQIPQWSDGTAPPDLRSVNESLQRQKAALRRSNEDLERFAAAASHDLRAPLGIIRTYGTVLSRIYAGESSQRYADGILSASARLMSMLDGMLQWARVDSSREIRRFDMAIVLDEVLQNLASSFDGVTVDVELDALPALAVARVHTVQIFQNLIDNAVKYRCGDSVSIRVQGRLDGEWVEYTITDDGRGIPAERQREVFELFRRLDPDEAESGAGVGLALVSRIIKRYSGDISVESAVGQGSTFHIRLPSG
jgi:signal transduction histidine kinase